MTFNDLPAGAMVFCDANCLVYAATADPTYGAACQRLLEEIENRNLQGCTSAHVLGDLSHRLMTIEAATVFVRPMTGMANWLRRHPAAATRAPGQRGKRCGSWGGPRLDSWIVAGFLARAKGRIVGRQSPETIGVAPLADQQDQQQGNRRESGNGSADGHAEKQQGQRRG